MEVLNEEHDLKDEKYIRELNEYWDAYIFAVINEIFVGIGVSLGLPPGKAYNLCKNKPGELKKAFFFQNIFNRFKNIFKYKIPIFRPVLPPVKKQLTEKQWQIINRSIEKYWHEHAHKITEDITSKGYVLGNITTGYRKAEIPHTEKSLIDISREHDLPSSLKEAYERTLSRGPRKSEYYRRGKFKEIYDNYDYKNSQKKVINKAFANIATYLSDTENNIKQAVRKQITDGINSEKTPAAIASDLYWNVQKGGYTAESVRRNWARVSATELNSVFEAGILAPYEAEAMESVMDDERAVYFVRVGGTCDWCVPRQGTIARLLPADIVSDSDSDSLSAIGIEDVNTDIAIWPGKNNVGKKKADWHICCPAHPYNAATFQPINLRTQKYSKELGRVVTKLPAGLGKYGIKETELKRPEKEIEERRPTYIGDNLVKFNNNIYEAVDSADVARKREAWERDRSLPIPVQRDTPQYRRIFEAA